MKKIISAVVASALTVSTLSAVCASAATEKYGNGMDFVLFGDSIAEGYDLKESEYNYGQILADYFGGTVTNYAKAGDETSDTLSKIADATSLADAEVVIISTGANDMIHYASNFLLKSFDGLGVLADGYTAADIPERPTFDQMLRMVDADALKACASDFTKAKALSNALNQLTDSVTKKKADDPFNKSECLIDAKIIPNIEKIISDIKAVNPDARIIVQTLYNPLQLQEEYLNEKVPASYQSFLSILDSKFSSIIDEYNARINALEGVEIADIYTDFTSGSEEGYAWYFTGFQDSSVNDFKVHPNQAGHLAIAANVINILDEKREDGGLLNITYEKLAKKSSYPEFALEKYNNVKGTYVLGDISGDCIIDAKDASSVLADYSATSTQKDSILSETQRKAGDINGDGMVDAKDASAILAYYSVASTGGNATLKNFISNK